jgi:hypothetical protein
MCLHAHYPLYIIEKLHTLSLSNAGCLRYLDNTVVQWRGAGGTRWQPHARQQQHHHSNPCIPPHRCTISCTISPICIEKVQWHWICVKQHSSSFMRDWHRHGPGQAWDTHPLRAAPNPSHSPQLTQGGSWCWVLVITTLAPMLVNAAWQHGQWAAWHTSLGTPCSQQSQKLGLGGGLTGVPHPTNLKCSHSPRSGGLVCLSTLPADSLGGDSQSSAVQGMAAT